MCVWRAAEDGGSRQEIERKTKEKIKSQEGGEDRGGWRQMRGKELLHWVSSQFCSCHLRQAPDLNPPHAPIRLNFPCPRVYECARACASAPCLATP